MNKKYITSDNCWCTNDMFPQLAGVTCEFYVSFKNNYYK